MFTCVHKFGVIKTSKNEEKKKKPLHLNETDVLINFTDIFNCRLILLRSETNDGKSQVILQQYCYADVKMWEHNTSS